MCSVPDRLLSTFSHKYSFAVFYLVSVVAAKADNLLDWKSYKPRICIDDENFSYQNLTTIRVFVGVSFRAIYDINEEQMELGVQLTLLEFWSDPTLGLQREKIVVPQRIPNYISRCVWTPETIIRNEKIASIYDLTAVNRGFKLIPGGYTYRYSRYRVTLDCPMDFRLYPMDTQTCSLILSLYGTKNDEARLSWIGEDATPEYIRRIPAVSMASNVQPLQFTLGYPPRLKSYNTAFLTGNSTLLECTFDFHRHITGSLINTYIPSLLVVGLSFMSFWLDVRAIPGRVTLGVTALLTLATQIVHTRSGLPEIAYLTAMDVWLFGCLIMVFCSLIEFTLAISLYQEEFQIKSKQKTSKVGEAMEAESNPPSMQSSVRRVVFNKKPSTTEAKSSSSVFLQSQSKLDTISRVLFPIAAFFFVVFYLVYYRWCASNSRAATTFFLHKIFLAKLKS